MDLASRRFIRLKCSEPTRHFTVSPILPVLIRPTALRLWPIFYGPIMPRFSTLDMVFRNEYYDMVESWSDTIILIYLIYSLIIACVIFCIENRYGSLPNGDPARWYHYFTLVLFEISFSFSIVMSIYRLWLIGLPAWNLWNVHWYLMNRKSLSYTVYHIQYMATY